jgi:hypothetical protein
MCCLIIATRAHYLQDIKRQHCSTTHVTLKRWTQTNQCIYSWPERHVQFYSWYIQGLKEETAIGGRIHMNDISKHTWSCTHFRSVISPTCTSPTVMWLDLTHDLTVKRSLWACRWRPREGPRQNHSASQSLTTMYFPKQKYREVIHTMCTGSHRTDYSQKLGHHAAGCPKGCSCCF